MTLATFHLTSTAIARRSMAYAFSALAARQAEATRALGWRTLKSRDSGKTELLA